MHTYLINLTRRPDRLAQMDDALKALSLPYTRIEAVDGADADISQPAGHYMPKGAFACYLSHIKAYRAFLESGASHCVIMEDDVALSPRLPKALESAAFYQDQNAILRLEAPTNIHWKLPSYSKLKAVTAQNGFASYELISKSYGTGAFIMPRAIAKAMVAQHASPVWPIDLRLFHQRIPEHPGFKILQISPALALQHQYLSGRDDSDIIQNALKLRWFERHIMARNFTNNLRSIFRRLARIAGFNRAFPFADN